MCGQDRCWQPLPPAGKRLYLVVVKLLYLATFRIGSAGLTCGQGSKDRFAAATDTATPAHTSLQHERLK